MVVAGKRSSDAIGRAAPPPVLPLFPLTGTLLLPGNYLPLNVFERRYRSLIEDVSADGGHVGMIQPLVPQADQWGGGEREPELYRVGCAGRIEAAERQLDGRYHVLLKGVSRFLVQEELEPRRGYRRIRASYVADATADGDPLDPPRLLAAVQAYARRHELEFDMDLLASLEAGRLLNALCAALPFAPAELQALLEADNEGRRQGMLLELMRMGEPATAEELYAPPVVH